MLVNYLITPKKGGGASSLVTNKNHHNSWAAFLTS